MKKLNNPIAIEILNDQSVDPGSLMSVANSLDCYTVLGFKALDNLDEILLTIFENIEEVFISKGTF